MAVNIGSALACQLIRSVAVVVIVSNNIELVHTPYPNIGSVVF